MKKQFLLFAALISCVQLSAVQPAYQAFIDFASKNKTEILGFTLLTTVVAYVTFELYAELNKRNIEKEEETEYEKEEQKDDDNYHCSTTTYYSSPKTTTYVQPVIHQPVVYTTAVYEPVVYKPVVVAKPAPYIAPAPQPVAPQPTPPALNSVKHPTYFDRLLDRQMDILD